MDFLGTPIGYLMNLIYSLVSNYGITIILLTLLFKIILLPLTLKQQKSIQATQAVQPMINEIQKKYANEKERQSQEMMKLYKEYNISPTAGCLPTLIQFPILIGLYGAIAKPLKFMLGMSAAEIDKLCKLVGVVPGRNYYYQIEVAEKAASAAGKIAKEIASGFPNFKMLDFNFLGLNLSMKPQLSYLTVLWILPVLAAILTFVSSKITQPPAQPGNDEAQSAQKTTKIMMYFFPIMILYLGFQVPAGLSLYWVINSLLQIAQFYLLDRKYKVAVSNNVEKKIEAKRVERRTKKKK